MSELPLGWALTTVGEAMSVAYGKSLEQRLRTDDGKYQYVGSGGPIASADERLTFGETIVVGRKGTAGSVQRFPSGCWPSDTTFFIEVPDGLNGALIEHQLRSANLVQHDRSTALPGLGRPDLEAALLSIPPSPEQERIVAAIEEAFSKLDAGQAGLQNVRQLLKRTREAVLAVTVTGRLVPQDSGETPVARILTDLGIEPIEPAEGSRVPDGWSLVRLADIARVGSGTTPKRGRSEYWEDGHVPWVASGALNAGVVTEPTEYVTELALRETSLRLWPAGTLLVAMYGEGQTRGRCAELAIEATCNQACAAIALRPELADYKQTLRLHFDANYPANRRLAAGGVQPNLSGALIKEMVVALPPPEEAGRIVAEVERQMSFIEACERSVDTGLEVSAALRRSVLRGAFEGRLVPQDPTDEPASVLLERIRAERAAAPKAKKRRTRATA